MVSRRTVLGGMAAAGVALGHLPAGRDDEELIELRRTIHRHPEIAGAEERTAGLVAARLRAAGLKVTTGVGGHGVVGVLAGGRPGRTVAYRADMDAVPPDAQIPSGGPLAHICGHDLHTTIGVGIAEGLARRRERLAGRFVFVFQPAEENLTGAGAMLDDGVFDGVRPTEIHALHCGPFPVGQIVVTPGFGMPGLDRGTVTTGDAAQVAARINALGTVGRPSTSADLEQVVVELETPDGPLSRFVFMSAQATGDRVQFSYRCWPAADYLTIRDEIRRLAAGAPVDFPGDPFPALETTTSEEYALQRHLHCAAVHAAPPFFGDDFALFLQQLPGTYNFLGVRRPGADIQTAFPHFVPFDPDERAIGYGVRAMSSWLTTRAASHPRE